jgi:hypothetical protein
MSTTILKNQKVWFDGYDLSTQINSLGLSHEAEAKDDTVLGDDTRSNKGGLKISAFSLQGFWNSTQDKPIFNNIGGSGKLITFGSASTEGSAVYMLQSLLSTYNIDGELGELLPFSLDAAARGNLVRGTLMENDSDVTTTQNGTARQVGAVTAAQKMYAGLHVTGVNGTGTLDVTVESDAADDFTGSESTRITFDQVTSSVGGQWKSVSGTITDDWWRVVATLGGASPDFDFVAALAIL